MSSKSGDREEKPPPAASNASWSISGRFITHYALSAFFLLSFCSALLYFGLIKSLERQSNRTIDDQMNVAVTLLGTAHDEYELEEDFEIEFSARELSRSFARIVDQEGSVLLQTYRMGQNIPLDAFPPPGEPVERAARWKSSGGRIFLLKSAWVTFGDPEMRRYVLQIAQDVTSLEGIIADYRLLLAAVTAIGSILSALAGVLIVAKGLSPIREMTELTRKISPRNLKERIGRDQWPEELKELSVTFDEMLDRLKEGFDRLSDHVSILAHELRNPINILMGEAEVALSRERDPEEYRQVLESSIQELGRLSRTIDSLLFIARYDIRETPLHREEINVCDEVAKIVDFYRGMGEDKKVSTECGGQIWLYADPTLFRRALGNLLSNAFRYTPAGGSITVKASYESDLSVSVTVTDTGSGIGKDDLPHIFDRFYRAESSRAAVPEGTGLGLAVVKSIMQHHGGSVSVESEVSRGTSVTLRFPLLNDDESVTNL